MSEHDELQRELSGHFEIVCDREGKLLTADDGLAKRNFVGFASDYVPGYDPVLFTYGQIDRDGRSAGVRCRPSPSASEVRGGCTACNCEGDYERKPGNHRSTRSTIISSHAKVL